MFDDLPSGNGLYIFNTEIPSSEESQLPNDPYGQVPEPFSYRLSQAPYTEEDDGGWVKIADSTNFKASKNIASAEVMLKPGAIRESELEQIFCYDFFFFLVTNPTI